MKKIRIFSMAILALASAFLMIACGSSEQEPEPVITLTAEDFEIRTLAAEVNEKVVTLKGRFTVDENKVDQEIKWGFLWRDEEDINGPMRKIYVGRGYEGTEFLIHEEGFPEGTSIMVCAFIEVPFTAGAEATELVGDEVFFDF